MEDTVYSEDYTHILYDELESTYSVFPSPKKTVIIPFYFFSFFYFKLEYSRLTMLCWFQVNDKVIKLYMYLSLPQQSMQRNRGKQ